MKPFLRCAKEDKGERKKINIVCLYRACCPKKTLVLEMLNRKMLFSAVIKEPRSHWGGVSPAVPAPHPLQLAAKASHPPSPSRVSGVAPWNILGHSSLVLHVRLHLRSLLVPQDSGLGRPDSRERGPRFLQSRGRVGTDRALYGGNTCSVFEAEGQPRRQMRGDSPWGQVRSGRAVLELHEFLKETRRKTKLRPTDSRGAAGAPVPRPEEP